MANETLLRACAIICTAIVLFAALRLGQNIFAPMLVAMVLGIVLSPVSDFADKIGLPKALSAFATMLVGLLSLITLALLLEPLVSQALSQAPIIWRELNNTANELRAMMQGLDEISESVAEVIDPESNGDTASEGVAVPKMADAVFYAPQYAAQLMIFVGTLYFFLLARKDVYQFAGESFPMVAKPDLVRAEKQVSRYFLTITIINATFGLIVAIVMTMLNMPSPALWGILAFLVNFVLYLGPAALACGLLLTGIIVFDGPASFVPAMVYLAMNATEGQFVTPAFVGKSMSVNPLMVFLSLVFWLWLWGPLGGFIAIPVLIWCLTVFRQSPQRELSDQPATAS